MEMIKNRLNGILKNQNFIYMIIVVPMGLVHVVLLFFFCMFHVDAMAFFNVSSIAIYLYCVDYLKRGKNPMRAFYFIYLEILAHSFMAAICVGWNLGFAQYMIGLVPFGYHVCMTMGTTKRQKYIVPTILGIGSFAMYLLCRFIGTHSLSSFYPLDLTANGEYIVYVFNTICVFILLFWSAFAFISDINRALGSMEETNEYLKELAYVDPLTGLYNRRHMMELFGEAGENYCVIMCDIDNFKRVNDNYGHDFGDLVLKETASLIKNAMDGLGYVCRWGGEEVVILHNGSFEKAYQSAETIRSTMCEHDFTMYGKTLHCSMTMGVAKHIKGEIPDETVKKADNRLYWGKQNGKNRVVGEDHKEAV